MLSFSFSILHWFCRFLLCFSNNWESESSMPFQGNRLWQTHFSLPDSRAGEKKLQQLLNCHCWTSLYTKRVACFILQIHTWNLFHWQIIRQLQRIIYTYFASQPVGVKSSLCLVLKMKFLVRISRMDGGCRGVATANSASWGDKAAPSFPFLFCPWRNFNRPWKFIALGWGKKQLSHAGDI